MVVQNLINRLILVDGYAVRTVRGVRSVLVQSFAFACQLGLMQTNPAAEIKMPKVRKRTKKDDKKVIPHDVCIKVLQAAQDDPMMRVTVTTLLFSGLRIGELLALRWGDIDFENKIITVDEAVVRRPIYNEDVYKRQNYAGIAFGHAGCAAVHALSYPLGGAHHVPHGESNQVMFAPVMKKYAEKKPDGKLVELGV